MEKLIYSKIYSFVHLHLSPSCKHFSRLSLGVLIPEPGTVGSYCSLYWLELLKL